MKETLEKPLAVEERPAPRRSPCGPIRRSKGSLRVSIQRSCSACWTEFMQKSGFYQAAHYSTRVSLLLTAMIWRCTGSRFSPGPNGWPRQVSAGFLCPRSVGGEENLPKFMAAFETLAFHDISLVIKLGVQFGLFAGSIQRLGTEYHHQKYLPDAASATLMGCFAMTEIGHGSNVQGLETYRCLPARDRLLCPS